MSLFESTSPKTTDSILICFVFYYSFECYSLPECYSTHADAGMNLYGIAGVTIRFSDPEKHGLYTNIGQIFDYIYISLIPIPISRDGRVLY